MLAQILTLFCALTISLCQSQMPQSLGIIINYELGASEKFKDYLKHFHEPICTAVTQFNVVVSAEARMQLQEMQESLKYLDKIIPINYIFTSQGQNFHFKLRVSNNSKADIYYVSKMSVQYEGCNNIVKMLFLAQRKAVGGMMGLVGQQDSLSSISADLTKLKNQFIYTRQTPQHFAMVQNIRVVSRHILQLSQSNISQVAKMRKQTKPICEEIFLNFVASHFYPELRPSFQKFQSLFDNQAGNQENSNKLKSACVKSYVQILGYLPVFYLRKQFKKAVWTNPNLPKIIQLKKFQLLGELQKQKEGQRLLIQLSSAEHYQKDSQIEFLSNGSQQLVLTTLRIITVLLFISVGFLSLQSLLLLIEEKKNRRK